MQILLRDVLGVATNAVALTPAAYFIASHFDGHTSVREIQVELARKSQGAVVDTKIICQLAEQLDQAGFLDTPNFAAMKAKVLAEYRADPVREPICAGGAYPDDPEELRTFLDRFFVHADGPGRQGKKGDRASIRGLVAPHIDLHRGGPCYAHAYKALQEGGDADLYVVFGTAHATPPHLFTLTRKSYDTPLGAVPTDQAVVDALAKELGEEELFSDELVHKSEHSVEFQILWLRHIFADRQITAVPVLCSSIDHLARPSEHVRRFMEALSRAVAGRKVCFVAGADLAHIGVMYGDERGATPNELEGYKRDDLETLRHFCESDAHDFAIDARRNGDQRRLCGTSPMFATKLAAGAGKYELLGYGQWTDGTDSVSFCAACVS